MDPDQLPISNGNSDPNNSLSFWYNKQVRTLLLQRKVNEHDWRHRPSCFTKGNECRYEIAKRSCKYTTFHVEPEKEDRSNVTKWFRLDDGNSDPREMTPFNVELKRHMGSQYLNVHNVQVSTVFACNTNVQIGESLVIYSIQHAMLSRIHKKMIPNDGSGLVLKLLNDYKE